MPDVFELEPTTTISRDDSYLLYYPFLLNYFAAKPSITPEEVVCGAHMAYGWMPRILELQTNKPNIDLSSAAGLLNTVKVTGNAADAAIEQLACLVDNSLVGASKLLHFISPHEFAIWDARVYAFVHQEKGHPYRVNNVSKYRHYLGLLSRLKEDCRFSGFHASVSDKIGYEVSPLRALELIMYLNASTY